MILRSILCNLITAVFIYLIGLALAEAEERQNLFDWYYSAVFGTGSYRIGDRDVFVVTVPYDKQIRAASEKNHEIILHVPVTMGFYDYTVDNIAELEIPSDVATLTVFPGIHYVIPLSEKWTIKPFVNLGYGKEFEGGEQAWIYSAGTKMLYRIRENAWRIAFGSALYYAGNTRKGQTDLGFAAFDAALDINHATPWQIDNQTMYLGGYAGIYLFSNLEFIQADEQTIQIHDQYEIGLTLSASKTMNILGMELDRIGLGYLTSKDFYAWRLVFSFPY